MDITTGYDPTLPLDVFDGSTNPDLLTEVTFGTHLENPDGSVPMVAKVGSGRKSPILARTMKEYDQEISVLKKENFSLKMRIYFLEERMQQKPGDGEDVFKTNIKLKVECENLKKELSDKHSLLKQASNAMENMYSNHHAEMMQVRDQTDRELMADNHKLQDKLKATSQLLEEAEQLLQHKKEEVLDLEEKLKTIDSEMKSLEQKGGDSMKALMAELEEKQKEIQALSSKNAALEKGMGVVESEKQRAQHKLDQLSKQIKRKDRDLEDVVDDQAQKIKDLSKELKLSRERIKSKDTVIGRLEDILKAKDEEKKEAKKALHDAEDQLSKEKSKIYKRNTAIQGMQLAVKEKTKKIEALAKQLKEQGEKLKQLQDEYHQMALHSEKTAQRQHEKLELQEQQLTSLKCELSQRELELENLMKSLGKKEGELEGFKDLLNKAQNALQQSEEAVEVQTADFAAQTDVFDLASPHEVTQKGQSTQKKTSQIPRLKVTHPLSTNVSDITQKTDLREQLEISRETVTSLEARLTELQGSSVHEILTSQKSEIVFLKKKLSDTQNSCVQLDKWLLEVSEFLEGLILEDQTGGSSSIRGVRNRVDQARDVLQTVSSTGSDGSHLGTQRLRLHSIETDDEAADTSQASTGYHSSQLSDNDDSLSNSAPKDFSFSDRSHYTNLLDGSDLRQVDNLRARLHAVEDLNETLNDELNVYEKLCKSDDVQNSPNKSVQSSDNDSELLRQHLAELRALRLKLEHSLKCSQRLQEYIEEEHHSENSLQQEKSKSLKLEQIIQQKEESLKRQKEQLACLVVTIKKQGEQVMEKDKTISELTQSIQEKEKQVFALHDKYKQAELSKKEKEEHNQMLLKKVEKLITQNEELNEENTRLVSQNEQLNKNYVDVVTQREHFCQEKEKLIHRNSRLNEDLRRADREITKLHEDLEKVQQTQQEYKDYEKLQGDKENAPDGQPSPHADAAKMCQGTRMGDSDSQSDITNQRVDSDVRRLYKICKLDDFEKLKKEHDESLDALRGIEASIKDRLNAYRKGSTLESVEYRTMREISMSAVNLRLSLDAENSLLQFFWTSQLPKEDMDATLMSENDELRSELVGLRTRLQFTNQQKKKLEDIINRQLRNSEKVMVQARENFEKAAENSGMKNPKK